MCLTTLAPTSSSWPTSKADSFNKTCQYDLAEYLHDEYTIIVVTYTWNVDTNSSNPEQKILNNQLSTKVVIVLLTMAIFCGAPTFWWYSLKLVAMQEVCIVSSNQFSWFSHSIIWSRACWDELRELILFRSSCRVSASYGEAILRYTWLYYQRTAGFWIRPDPANRLCIPGWWNPRCTFTGLGWQTIYYIK